MRKNKLLLLLALLLTAATGAWAQDYYAPSTDEVIILNEVYNASNSGYSSHSAIAWGGSASTSNKKAGNPNNGGVSTSSTVSCYSVKGTGQGKNITLSITGVSKVIVYHERNSSRYIELRDGSKTGNIIGSGQKNTWYTEVALTATNEYSIFLHGTSGSDDADFYVYAIKLIAAADPAPAAPADPAPTASADPAPTASAGYTVTMKDGVKDADKWTITPTEATTTGVAENTEVTLQYNGRLKVKGVKATSDEKPAEEPVTLATPLTIEAVTAGTIMVNIDGTLDKGMKYSVNGGTKTTITSTTTIEGLKAGDKVQFYGNGTQTQVYGGNTEVRIQGSGVGFKTKAYGNIMSLLDEEGFATKTDLPNNKFVFYGLFKGNTTLIDASELLLPATTLADCCYSSMFNGCTSLTTAPKLPATTLVADCYYSMFDGCTSLTSAYVKAAYIEDDDECGSMFNDCTATGAVLHTAPGSKASWEIMMGTAKPWPNWTVAGDWDAEQAAKPAATVTTAPTGAAIVGVGKNTALVSGGVADGGTLWYAVTTTNTKPASTDGFSGTVPTAQTITASGTVYVWYYVKGDDTHSDSEIAATAIEVPVADIVWDATNVSGLEIWGTEDYEVDGVMLRGNAENISAGWVDYGDPATLGIVFEPYESGGYTFTAPSGKAFKKIVMNAQSPAGWYEVNLGDGWTFNFDDSTEISTVTWKDSAASSVELLPDTDDFSGAAPVKSIAFYLSE